MFWQDERLTELPNPGGRTTAAYRSRAEQLANQLRQEWQEQKQTLLMS